MRIYMAILGVLFSISCAHQPNLNRTPTSEGGSFPGKLVVVDESKEWDCSYHFGAYFVSRKCTCDQSVAENIFNGMISAITGWQNGHTHTTLKSGNEGHEIDVKSMTQILTPKYNQSCKVEISSTLNQLETTIFQKMGSQTSDIRNSIVNDEQLLQILAKKMKERQ